MQGLCICTEYDFLHTPFLPGHLINFPSWYSHISEDTFNNSITFCVLQIQLLHVLHGFSLHILIPIGQDGRIFASTVFSNDTLDNRPNIQEKLQDSPSAG